MVTFSITFILALPRLQEKTKPKKKGKGKGGEGKKKKKKDDAKGKKEDIDKENKIPETVQTTYQIGKPLTSFHVEYFMPSETDKYDIDVNCWEPAAKIYFQDQSKITKTIVKEETTWITFNISHSRTQLSLDELEKLFETTLEFNISDSKKKSGNRAKSDNPKVFYRAKTCVDYDENEIWFEQLFNTAEETADSDSLTSIKQIVEERLLIAGVVEKGFNQLYALPLDQHRPQFREIVKHFRIEDKLPTKTPYTVPVVPEPIQEEPKNKKKGKGSTSKASKKKKEPSGLDLNIKIDAKQLFTGMSTIKEEAQPVEAGLTYAAVLISVWDLIDKEMAAERFNPLITHIAVLRNLPHELLLENRISNVYLSYKLVDTKIDSPPYPVERNMSINQASVNLVHHFNTVKFIQFLQTDLLTVQLIGIMDPIDRKIKPCIFGEEHYDQFISRRMNSQCPEVRCLGRLMDAPTVILANASFNLSGLLIGHLSNKWTALLEVPNRLNSESHEDDNELLNVDAFIKSRIQTPLTNAILLSNNTNLEINVMVMAPLRTILHRVQADKDILNRIFMVFEDEDRAIDVVTKLYQINQAVLGPSTIASDFAKAKGDTYNLSLSQGTRAYLDLPEHKERGPEIQMMVERSTEGGLATPSQQISLESSSVKMGQFSAQKALTGFIIDAFNKIIVFVEGQMNGTLQQVWTEVMNLPNETGNLLYNSELIFESRLYYDFIPYGGFHIVTLRAPLDMYLANPKTFLEGYMPDACWKALLNFDLLLKTSSMSAATRKKLFPTAETLLSFDIEFGIPLHHQEPEEMELTKSEMEISLETGSQNLDSVQTMLYT